MKRNVGLMAAILGLAPLAGYANVTGIAGAGNAFSTLQPSLGVNYLIRTQGLYPSGAGSPVGTLGEVVLFGSNITPQGFLPADGRLLPIAQNQALFSLVGTSYGGDGRTTFALPDLRGRTAIGAGAGPGLTPWNPGDRGGTENVTLTIANLPSHIHTIPSGPTGLTDPNGFNAPYQNMQPSLAINYIVPMQGIYPARDGGGPAVTSDPTLGFVYSTASVFLPDQWTAAQGQIVPISQNTALFSLLGTFYGGNGKSTFALPDLRGRAPVGAATGVGSAPDLGAVLGTETSTMTVDQLAPHHHSAPSIGSITGVTGGGQTQNTMQPVLGLHYVIALDGVFPTTGGTDEPLIGEIGLFASTFAPAGWAFCAGQLLPIDQYPTLFSVLGTQFGGDGLNTFALPNLEGRIAVDAGTGPGLSSWQVGDARGAENITILEAQLPSHSHTFAVPEPGSAGLLLLGSFALCARRRRVSRAV